MPADSISNCKCPSRYGRDEIAGTRATRGISSSSVAKRIAVFHERTSKKDITRSIDTCITDVFTVFISASFFHNPLVLDAGSISDRHFLRQVFSVIQQGQLWVDYWCY